MMFYNNRGGGFVKLIILIVIGLIVLGYFGFNVAEIMDSPMVKNNLEWAWNVSKNIWNNFLEKPATFVWDKLVVGFAWTNIQRAIDNKAVEASKNALSTSTPQNFGSTTEIE